MTRRKKSFSWLLGGFTAVLISGCSSLTSMSQESSQALAQPANEHHLSQPVSELLSANHDVFSTSVDPSKKQLIADATYFSANSQYCRKVQIIQAKQSHKERFIACQQEKGVWTRHNSLP